MNEKTVHIKSFGCQMNKLDTALVAAALKDADFEISENEDDADVVLINTCSVREHAEEKVFSHLGNLKHIKQTRPQLIVAVFGCMAQRLGDELLKHPAVDIVCGPAQIPQITMLIKNTLKQKQKAVAVTRKIRADLPDEQTLALENFETVFDAADNQLPAQAFVRAMRGCDNFCSYCVVPYVRGPQVSRPPKLVIEQIKKLADDGVKLVTLLGQRINAYKYTNGQKTYCLADLLEMASRVNGIQWIRFVTSYPSQDFYDEILSAMASLPKVCNYLHMPAQSGSEKILKKMNRNYTAESYLDMLEKARAQLPDIALSGDFIVGFPGETDEDFQATAKLLQKARYKNAFIFKYSPRPGTKAVDKLKDDIAIETKKQRNNDLLKIQEKISDELSTSFLNKQVKILVEGLSKKPHLNNPEGANTPQLIGRTAEDWIVVFNGPQNLAGEFVNVRITKTSPLTLFGELC